MVAGKTGIVHGPAGRVGEADGAADVVQRRRAGRGGIIGNEGERDGPGAVVRKRGGAIDDVDECPAVIRAGDEEFAIGRIALGVGDGNVHPDVGHGAGAFAVGESQRAAEGRTG